MSQGKSMISQIIVGVAVAVIPVVILAYFFGLKPNGDRISEDPGSPSDQIVNPAPPPKTDNRTQITIMYSGDMYNCQLPITITIAGQSIIPQGNAATFPNVPTGVQQYSISGQIHCPWLGSCMAQGTGSIHIQPNQTYYLTWANTSYAACTILLSQNL